MASKMQALVHEKSGVRGIAVIITNDYDGCPNPKYRYLPCHIDGEEMRKTFKDTFEFACLWKKNATAEEIKKLASDTASCDYSESYKFIVFAFSGHGENGPLLVANDAQTVSVDNDIVDLFEPFKVPKNRHITKLFFFDSCRGNEPMERAIPKGGQRGNYLIAFSSMENYKSWATAGGSVWMTLLAKMLREEKDSVQNILARVREECLKKDDLLQCPPTFDTSNGIVRLYNGATEKDPSAHPNAFASQTSDHETTPASDKWGHTSSANGKALPQLQSAPTPAPTALSQSTNLTGVNEKMIIIASGESHSIIWEKFGFQMHIPEDAFGSSDTCVVAIRAVVTGNFQFPENTEPVSAIYGISTSFNFAKPITLEMQHCVALKREEDCRYLSFAVAHIQPDHPHLPCSFTEIEGGSFSPGSQYGTISCSSFCYFTTLKHLSCIGPVVPSNDSDSDDENDAEIPQNDYTMMTFYKSTSKHQCRFDFAAMKKLDAIIETAKKCWGGAEEDPPVAFQFADGHNKVILGLEDEQEVEGWHIIPTYYPCIMQCKCIDAFGTAQTALGPPFCRILVTATDHFQRFLNYKVTITGATDVKNVLIHRTQDQVLSIIWDDLIMIKPWLNNQSICSSIALDPTCDNLATLLLKNPMVVEGLRVQNPANDAFVSAVLNQWYAGKGNAVPFTWRDLIQCMRGAGLNPRTVQTIEQHVL